MAEIEAILDGLADRLGPLRGPPRPLPGGITNRNYRVEMGDAEYVVRVPGRDTELLGINRQAERLAARQAAELGIGPAVLVADERCLVTHYIPYGPVDPDRLRTRPESAAMALRAFHGCGLQLPTRFWVPEQLDSYAAVVRDRRGRLPAAFEPTRRIAAEIAQALPLREPVPCHNDLLPANLLASTPSGDAYAATLVVDWEYAGMGHRLFDLGNLAAGSEFDDAAQERLLSAYFDEPPSPGRRAALALMRILSDAREAAWALVQAAVSELDFDFGAYATRHFKRLLEAAADSRLEAWLDAAAA